MMQPNMIESDCINISLLYKRAIWINKGTFFSTKNALPYQKKNWKWQEFVTPLKMFTEWRAEVISAQASVFPTPQPSIQNPTMPSWISFGSGFFFFFTLELFLSRLSAAESV